jgi:hypothetical protein
MRLDHVADHPGSTASLRSNGGTDSSAGERVSVRALAGDLSRSVVANSCRSAATYSGSQNSSDTPLSGIRVLGCVESRDFLVGCH